MKKLLFLIVLGFSLIITGCGDNDNQGLAVEDGQEYTIISFGSADVETKEGEEVPCYIVTFSYDEVGFSDEDLSKAKTRGTISVPVDSLTVDRVLAKNTIVWDEPRTIEGKTYRKVRWNPSRVEKAITKEKVREEEPIIKR